MYFLCIISKTFLPNSSKCQCSYDIISAEDRYLHPNEIIAAMACEYQRPAAEGVPYAHHKPKQSLLVWQWTKI